MADPAMVGVLALGALASFVAMGAIMFPAVVWGHVHPSLHDGGPVDYAVCAVALWAASFVSVFTSGAVVAAAMMRAEGRDPTVGQALAAAWARRGPLAAWATLSTLVGLLSAALERFRLQGLVMRLVLGLAWAVATTFAVPLIIADGTMPIETVRRSATMVKRYFGPTIRSEFRLSLVWVLAMIGGIAVAVYGAGAVVVGIDTADPIEVAVGAMVSAIGLLIFLFSCVTSSALTAYLNTVLFRYATGRPVPGIDPAHLPPLPPA
jgi:hypothetical protein